MSDQEIIIKPSSRYWTQEISATILCMIVLPIAGILYFGGRMYVAGGLALLVGVTFLISEFRTIRRWQIIFSQSGIAARNGKADSKQSWDSIKAVKITGQRQSKLLVLYCEEHNLNIPIRFFDETELMEKLKEHLPTSILHPQAYQRLPQFLEWQESITQKISNLDKPLKVSFGNTERWVGSFSIGLGTLLAVLYCFSVVEAIAAIIPGGMFWVFGLLLLLSCPGWIEGNNEIISVSTLFRKVNFSWNDLREIYRNSNRGVLAFVGDSGRLIVPSPSNWSGKDKELLLDLILLKIEMSRLELIESRKPLFWRSKNAYP